MNEYILLYIFAAVFGISIIGFIYQYWPKKKPTIIQQTHTLKVKRDWLATGRINFIGDWENVEENRPSDFYVQVEENRLLYNVDDSINTEIRWRQASLNEVKRIVARYHQHLEEHPELARNDPMTMDSSSFV